MNNRPTKRIARMAAILNRLDVTKNPAPYISWVDLAYVLEQYEAKCPRTFGAELNSRGHKRIRCAARICEDLRNYGKWGPE